MSPQHTPINPSSLKSRFARRFLRALKNLKKNSHRSITTPLSTREISRRSHRVKLAAYVSMASVVGSRRAWSRAIMLQQARNRARKGGLVRKKRIIINTSHALKRRRKMMRGGRERNKNPNPKKDHIEGDEFGGELRKLVPGGEEMDTIKLLEETAHYVKCLATQVDVMRRIVNFCSN